MKIKLRNARHFVCLSLFLVVCNAGYAQRDSTFHWSISGGGSTAVGPELTKVYDLGLKISTGFSFPLIHDRVRLNPTIGFNYFGNNYNEAARDNLFFWNLGTRVELNPKLSEGVKFIPFAGVFYLTGNNYITPRKGYSGESVDLFKYSGVGFDFGFRIQFNSNLFVAIAFDIVKPKAKISTKLLEDIKDELEIDSEIYDVISMQETKLSFNNLNISLGYKISFR